MRRKLASVIVLALMATAPLMALPFAGTGDAGTDRIDQAAAPPSPDEAVLGERVLEALGGLEGSFIPNVGQLEDDTIRYYAPGNPLSVGVAPWGMVFTLYKEDVRERLGPLEDRAVQGISTTFNLRVVGCREVEPVGVEPSGQEHNFFIGQDPSRWAAGVTDFKEVLYEDIYDGVDLKLYFRQGSFKYEFHVESGTDPGVIALRYEGVNSIHVDASTGELVLPTVWGEVRDERPVAFVAGEELEASFRLVSDGLVRFELPSRGPFASNLVIDPGLRYSTFVSGTSLELAQSIALDSEGNVYASMESRSDDFPTTPGAYNTAPQACVLVKFDPKLQRLLYSTYWGGEPGQDLGTFSTTMHIRSDGNILMTGNTFSETYTVTTDALEPVYLGARDAFITMFSPDGKRLLYSSYFGSSGYDFTCHSELDADDNLYIATMTTGTDYPVTQGAFCSTLNGPFDNAAAKLDSTLKRILFCTYYGGSGDEYNYHCDIDEQGSMYLLGITTSEDLPGTEGAYCSTVRPQTGDDGFIAKLSPDGHDVVWATTLGSALWAWPKIAEVLDDGRVFIVSETDDGSLSVVDPIQSQNAGGVDLNLYVLSADGERMLFASYLGGSLYDGYAWSDVVNETSNVVYFVGSTSSTDLPTTKGCYDPTFNGGEHDVALYGIDMDDYSLAYCSYIGGPRRQFPEMDPIDIDASGAIYGIVSDQYASSPTPEGAYCRSVDCIYAPYFFKIEPWPVDPPRAPDNLHVTGFGDGYVSLAWDPIYAFEYELQGYELLRGDDAEHMAPFASLGLATEYNDTGLVNGQEYYYCVRAENSAGLGDRSSVVKGIPMDIPGPPFELVAFSGDGTASLEWRPPTYDGGRVVGYHVLRGTSADNLAVIGSPEGLNFTDPQVANGTFYYYAVTAYNELGDGPRSELAYLLAWRPPDPPKEVSAVPGDRMAAVSWQPPDDLGGSRLIGYRVYLGTSPGAMQVVAHKLPNELGHAVTGLENGMTYYVAVSALTIHTEGPRSEAVPVVPFGTPDAPTALVAVPRDGSVLLGWAPPANDGGRPIVGYGIYWGTADGALQGPVAGGAGTSYLVTGLTNGVAYGFAVAAMNTAGEGARTATVAATPYGPPGTPTGLTGKVTGEGIALTWTAPAERGQSPTISYRVLRGTSIASMVRMAETGEATTFLDASAVPRTTYHYAVQAFNPASEGEPTGTLSILMPAVPGAPMNLTTFAGDSEVWLSWSPPRDDGGAGVTAYIVLRGESIDDMVEVARLLSMEYDDLGVVNGREYLYSIRAVNVAGAGVPSNVVAATPEPPPGPPTSLKLELDGSDVTLKWTPPDGDGITGYEVLRGPSRDALVIIADVTGQLTYTDRDIERGRTYYYTVRARSPSGEGDAAEPVKLTVEEPLNTSMMVTIVLVVVVVVLIADLLLRRRGRTAGKEA